MIDRAPARRRAGASSLAAFAALGLLGTLAFSRTLADPSLAELLLPVVLSTALLASLDRLGGRLRQRRAALPAAALTVLALAAGLLAAGVELRLLAPAHWDELGALLDEGIARASQVEMPYSGDDTTVAIALAAAAPTLLILAAAVAAWPAGRGLRLVSPLLLALSLYVVGIALVDAGSPGFRALALCAVSALWLWAGAERRGDPRLAIAVVALLAVSATALTARAGAEPGWDYRNWNLLGGERSGLGFDWNHSYGPFDWSQDGTELLRIEAEGDAEPAYWKASVLDSFDGVVWRRAEGAERGGVATGVPLRSEPSIDFESNVRESPAGWVREYDVEVLSLGSPQVISAGTATNVYGIDGASIDPDGTVSGEISPGDSYAVRTYVPDPPEPRLSRAGGRYDPTLAAYTSIGIPDPELGEPSLASFPLASADSRVGRQAGQALDGTPYAEVLQLTRQVTAGARTPYEKVSAVEDFLAGEEFTYFQSVPDYQYPLASFLLDDRRGYCQHFAGAMALMLRMSGVPTRVVSGFAPGEPGEGSRAGSFSVTDREAHSWVEVYFNDIGWVSFDPTPAAAPAQLAGQAPGISIPLPRGGAAIEGLDRDRQLQGQGGGGGDESGAGGEPGSLALLWASAAALAVLGLATTIGLALVRRRRLLADRSSERRLRELRDALARLGWSPRPGETLLGLEHRLRRDGASSAASYAAQLASARYARAGGELPSLRERGALRRSLSAHRGLRRRLAGYRAIPPGGPRG